MPDSNCCEPGGKKEKSEPVDLLGSAARNGLTPLGADRKLATPLPYLLFWITGLVFYYFGKNKYVKYHALQSTIVFGVITALQLIIWLIRRVLMVFLNTTGPAYPVMNLLGMISAVIWVGSLVLWAFLMAKAYQGENYRFPVAGDMAAKGAKLFFP